MTRLVLYVGHPVAPTAEEIAAVKALHGQGDRDTTTPLRCRQAIEMNLQRAMKWLSWLRRSFPETTFIAPWIVGLMSGEDDTDPAARERGLVDCCAVVERCDGIVLVGQRISTGMARERDHGLAHGFVRMEPDPYCSPDRVFPYRPAPFAVYDLTSVLMESITQSKWMDSPRGPGTCRITFVEWAEIFLG